ncbi:MAG TPA: inner membrane-spanning protein YciB [Nevskiaceae bacterium]|nr:inner membrane-spanning protein YciB [Nevskiaceae bacterium]
MKPLLDFSPLAVFLLSYWLGGIYVATGALMVSLWIAFFLHRALFGSWSRISLWVAIVATVLGGLTVYLRDPGFIKLKPTIIYGVFAVALLGSHFIGDKVLLARMPQQVVVAPDALWRKLNFAWALFFAGCAALNLYVAHHYSEAAWVKFKVIGFTVLPFVFALAQAPFLSRYVVAEPK